MHKGDGTRKVAIVGFGFMGRTLYGAWKKCRGAKVVAICDANLSQLMAKVKGNIKGALITSDSSFAPASSLVWDASGRIFFEKAMVYFGPFYRAPLTVYPEDGKPFSPKLPSKTGYEAEVEYFLGRIEGRRQKYPHAYGSYLA